MNYETGHKNTVCMSSEYHPLIADALREYSESADVVYDKALAKRYAEYAIARIKQ